MSRPLIIYHANCIDGFCAAWVAHELFGDHATYHAASYGEPPPDVIGRDVHMLDFSYDRETTVRVLSTAAQLVILDHHVTAAKDLIGLSPMFHFDMRRSGAGMAWDYFFPLDERPWLVDYVEDRDLWRFELPRSREINAWISTLPFEFAQWSAARQSTTETVAAGFGSLILRKTEQYVRELAVDAREQMFDGRLVWVVNAPKYDVSELLARLLTRTTTNGPPPFVVAWRQRRDGEYEYSLRSTEIDVSEIARRYGGGGHRLAAGFTCTEMVHL